MTDMLAPYKLFDISALKEFEKIVEIPEEFEEIRILKKKDKLFLCDKDQKEWSKVIKLPQNSDQYKISGSFDAEKNALKITFRPATAHDKICNKK